MADHDDLPTLVAHLGHFDVDLGNQGTGGVEDAQPALARRVPHGAAHAVGREDHGGVVGYLVQLVDEDGPLAAQVSHHVIVVDDLVPDVDRRAVRLQRPFDDLDRAIDPGTESARLREYGFHQLLAPVTACRGFTPVLKVFQES